MSRPIIARCVSALFALLLMPAAAHAGQVRISVGSNFFLPNSVQLNLGDQVTWVWTGSTHNVGRIEYAGLGRAVQQQLGHDSERHRGHRVREVHRDWLPHVLLRHSRSGARAL